jgi:hypothetical protein
VSLPPCECRSGAAAAPHRIIVRQSGIGGATTFAKPFLPGDLTAALNSLEPVAAAG